MGRSASQWRARASRLGALDLGPVDRGTSGAEVAPSLASLRLELLPRLAHPELVACRSTGGWSQIRNQMLLRILPCFPRLHPNCASGGPPPLRLRGSAATKAPT